MIFGLSRKVCNLKRIRGFKYYIRGSKYYCSSVPYVEVPSALHLVYHHKKTVFQPLSPFLEDFDYFENVEQLYVNLRKRGSYNFTIDYLQNLKENCWQHSKIFREMAELKNKKSGVAIQIKRLAKSDTEDKVEKINCLKKDLNEYSVKIEDKYRLLQELEIFFILPYLNLPNYLHKSTPDEDVDLITHFCKPTFNFEPKSHMDIGLTKKDILKVDVSPNSCYLSGNLAVLELAMGDFILQEFKKCNYRSVSITDFAKAVLVEGCGGDPKNEEEIFEIYDPDCLSSSLKQYLVGGSSLPSLLSLFCKLIKLPSFQQPFRSIAIGRKYTPIRRNQLESTNLYNLLQHTSAGALVLYSNYSAEEERILEEINNLITGIYTKLGLHFKVIKYNATKLKKQETMALGICLYSPYKREYVEIGRISVCGDYIGKRLQCIEGVGQKQGAFLAVVYIEIMNITKWLACMIENLQTADGDYQIPHCLEPFMYGIKCNYK